MDIPKERPPNANDTQTASEIAVTAAASVLVFITVILRFLSRWALKKRVDTSKGTKTDTIYGLDDLFNVFSVLTFYGLVAAVCIAIQRGMGTHVQLILFERGTKGLSEYNQAVYVSSIFYNTVLGMIKLSVLSLYHRILRGVQSQALRLIVWAMFAIVAANTFANVLVCIFQCRPIKAAWDVSIPADQKHCVEINAFYLGNAITGVATDAIVYFLSIPIVKPLQMDTKTKLQLLATMLVGGFAVITSGVRLGFIPALLEDSDVSMAMGVPMNWSVAEPAVGILVSSMPAIRALRFLWRKPGDDSYGSGAAQSAYRGRTGNVHLCEIRSDGKMDAGSATDRGADADSEEYLFVGNPRLTGLGKISRTTELEISYSDN